MNGEGTKTIVRSVARALDIVYFIANADQAPSFTAIQKETGIPKSSLSNLLKELVYREYIEYDSVHKGDRAGRTLIVLSATIINKKDINHLFSIQKKFTI